MTAHIDRVASRFDRRHKNFFSSRPDVPFSIRDPEGRERTFGDGPPRYTLAATNERAMSALDTLDGLVIAEAYLSGNLDVDVGAGAERRQRAIVRIGELENGDALRLGTTCRDANGKRSRAHGVA